MGNSGVNRRDFLKTITIGGGSIGLVGGLTKFGMSETTGLGWDEEADVVIAGFGGAGGAAAVEASDAGCSVLILEKHPAGVARPQWQWEFMQHQNLTRYRCSC